MTTDQKWAKRGVVTGIGWPGQVRKAASRFSTGIGWPSTRGNPQDSPSYPQGRVSRETTPTIVESPEARAATGTAEDGGSAPGAPDRPSEATSPSASVSDAVATAPVTEEGTASTETFDASAYEDSTPLARQVAEQIQARARVIGQPLKRADDTRIMVVANQKGGVGKTTTTVNLAAALAQHGLRVLVVDLDPQGNASTALSVDHQRGVVSTYDVLVEGTPLAEATHPHPDLPNLFCAPATIDLAGAEVELVNVMSRESRLKKALAADPRVHGSDEERYDYVFIDCPPSLGLLTLNALVAGEEVLIPIQAEYYALEGLGQLIETVDMVRTHLNQELAVSSILITMYDARTRLASAVAEEVRGHFGEQVLRTSIPRSVRVSEAPSYGQSVMTYDPGSPGALSYLEAARELNSRRIG